MMPSGYQLIIVLVVVLLLFGSKKIPELAKGMGQGIKNFKKAIKEDEIENKADAAEANEKIEEKTKVSSSDSEEKTKQS